MMTITEMLNNIISRFGFESQEAIGFALDIESGSDEDWLRFLYHSTMERPGIY